MTSHVTFLIGDAFESTPRYFRQFISDEYYCHPAIAAKASCPLNSKQLDDGWGGNVF